VQEPVQGGAGHDRVIGKDLAPVGEGLVAGEDDGLAVFVALANDLEQERGLGGIEREVANLVDDEQLGPGQIFHFPVEFVFGQGHGQFPGHIDGGGEVDAVAQFRTQHAEGGGQVPAKSWVPAAPRFSP